MKYSLSLKIASVLPILVKASNLPQNKATGRLASDLHNQETLPSVSQYTYGGNISIQVLSQAPRPTRERKIPVSPETMQKELEKSGKSSLTWFYKNGHPVESSVEDLNMAAISGSLEVLKSVYAKSKRLPDLPSIEKAASQGKFEVVGWYWSKITDKPDTYTLIKGDMYFLAEWCFLNDNEDFPTQEVVDDAMRNNNRKALKWMYEHDSGILPSPSAVHYAEIRDYKEAVEWVAEIRRKNSIPSRRSNQGNVNKISQSEAYPIFERLPSKIHNSIPERQPSKVRNPIPERLPSKVHDLSRQVLPNDRLHIHQVLELGMTPKPDAIKESYINGDLDAIKALYEKFPSYTTTLSEINCAAKYGHISILNFVYTKNPTLLPDEESVEAATGGYAEQVANWYQRKKLERLMARDPTRTIISNSPYEDRHEMRTLDYGAQNSRQPIRNLWLDSVIPSTATRPAIDVSQNETRSSGFLVNKKPASLLPRRRFDTVLANPSPKLHFSTIEPSVNNILPHSWHQQALQDSRHVEDASLRRDVRPSVGIFKKSSLRS